MPEYLERYHIQPNELAVSRPWAAGDASYLGTTLMSGRSIEPSVAERLHIELGRLAGVRAAVDRLDERVLLVRLLSASGPPFHEGRRWIRDFVYHREQSGTSSKLSHDRRTEHLATSNRRNSN
jgi:urease accessory protein UreH